MIQTHLRDLSTDRQDRQTDGETDGQKIINTDTREGSVILPATSLTRKGEKTDVNADKSGKHPENTEKSVGQCNPHTVEVNVSVLKAIEKGLKLLQATHIK